MALQQRQPQPYTPNRFFNPDDDFVPSGAAAPPPGTAPQPAPAATSPAATAPADSSAAANTSSAATPATTSQPAPSLTPAVDPMSSAAAFHAPSQADYVKANTPARPIGDFDKIPDGQPGADTWANRHNKLRQGLAAIAAGLAEYGGQQNHNPGQGARFADRWLDQDAAQRQYDANQGRTQAAATVAGAGQQLSQANQQLGNEELGARVGLTRAQTQLALQNLPAQEAAEKLHGIIQDAWLNKKIPPAQFQQWANEQISAAPANVGRMVQPHVADIMKMPPTGKGYSLTMQDDLPKSVNVYGKEYDRNDPQLEQVAPGAGADYDRAMAAHNTKRGEKLTDEKTVAGFAAERQGAGFQQAQTMEGRKAAAPYLADINDANNQQQMISDLLGGKMNPASQTAAMFKMIGLEQPTGTHRIMPAEIEGIEQLGGISDKLKQKLMNWKEGDRFSPDLIPDVISTAKILSQNKVKTANDNLESTYRNTGYKVPGTDGRGRLDGGGQQQSTAGGGHQVGDIVVVGNKKVKISAIHADGTFDGDPQ